ncbi:MAG: UDP-N-acetylmuramoyl-tripeptide--D-alanyl-D-alanine ligase [Sphingobium sp.]|nr:UDP-N-acetylmuramoyl-tripeptide--D-alanyl-D-alanine ligase [Sphingobium sp.]MCP5397987.1 UDP-N-acetylmuramoyl-tripeptide--D-alanyl-D-alanine ligase [Sphingomonas sp.]
MTVDVLTRPLWTGQEVARAVGGVASSDFAIGGVAFDSREVGEGDLFIALKGEATDGHKFLEKAFAAGAAGALVSNRTLDQSHILVKDTTAALNALGVAARARMQGKVIGVTGSVGKTSTKEALYRALDRFRPGQAHRSVKSYNNHVGVPLSLARMPRDSLFGIFEMGMNHAGELSALTRLVRPHVAIVTAIAPAHIEFFESEEAIARAKAEIFEGLEPGGIAIVPYDSPYCALLSEVARRHGAQVVTFGLGEGADVRATEAVPAREGGTMVAAKLPHAELCYTVASPGDHNVLNSLAILAAVEAVGGDLAAAGLALAEMPGLAGRGARNKVRLGQGEALLIDESYNANPLSISATLKQLGREQAGRRLAVLGAMKELGNASAELHAGLADPILQAGVDYAILVGDEMKPLADRLAGKLALEHVANAAVATQLLKERIRPDDAILVKGSNSVGLSHLVEAMVGGDA